jgi:hypothetical protein
MSTPVPNPTPPRAEDLLAVMRRAADGTAVREDVLRALITSTITVALEGDAILAARTADDTPVALAFTDGEAMTNWAGDRGVAWGALSGADLVRYLNSLPQIELVVNVKGPYPEHLDRDDLERLAEEAAVTPAARRTLPRREVLDPSEVELLTAAAPLAPAVTSALAAALPALEGALAVYALELRAGETRRPALGVELAPGADTAPIAAGLQEALAEVLEPGDELDLVPLREDHLEALRNGGHEPIWARDE